MGGAVLVGFSLVLRSARPQLWAAPWAAATRSTRDSSRERRVGIGWGLAGFCPGPRWCPSARAGQGRYSSRVLLGMFAYTAAERLIHEPRRRAKA
jgi:hypothetical protein